MNYSHYIKTPDAENRSNRPRSDVYQLFSQEGAQSR